MVNGKRPKAGRKYDGLMRQMEMWEPRGSMQIMIEQNDANDQDEPNTLLYGTKVEEEEEVKHSSKALKSQAKIEVGEHNSYG